MTYDGLEYKTLAMNEDFHISLIDYIRNRQQVIIKLLGV